MLVLAAVAAALYPSVRGRRAVAAMVGAGAALAVVEGAARIGAGVGGVILVCVSFALAAAMMAQGELTRRRAVLVLRPVLGLAALAAIDLLTAHGSGHYTGSVLHAHSAGEIRDLIVRRYHAAWLELGSHAMPFAAACALAAAVIFVVRRTELLSPRRPGPCLGGGAARGGHRRRRGRARRGLRPGAARGGGLHPRVGAGVPVGRPLPARHSPGTPPESRSRALRQPVAPGR